MKLRYSNRGSPHARSDVAALPLVRLVLQTLDEVVLRLPFPPTVSCHEAVSQMLLRPQHIVLDLRTSGVLLQLFDLHDIAISLGIKVDG